MKRLLIKSLSLCLILCCIISISSTINIFAETKTLSNQIIDQFLLQKLTEMASEDSIQVSIWFDDIDHNSIKNSAKEQFENRRSKKSLDISATKILDNDVDINDFRDDRYIDDVQEIINIKRNISANTYYEYNTRMRDVLVKDLCVPEKI